MFRVELDTKERLVIVDDSFICCVIGICKEDGPIRRQGIGVDSKAMILCGDEAAVCSVVDTRDVVPSVAISGKRVGKVRKRRREEEKT